MKKRRGAGNRGGRGNAGSGKRGDANKPGLQVKGFRFGKFGFKRGGEPRVDAIINVGMVEQLLPTFEKDKVATRKGDVYELDLGKAGYTKLLSKGIMSSKVKITIDKATPKAIDKVKAAGGEIVNLNNNEPQEETQ